MTNLGEKLKLENQKRKREAEEADRLKRMEAEKEATREAESRFQTFLDGEEDFIAAIKALNKKKQTSIDVFTGSGRNGEMTSADYRLFFKLQVWAKENGLKAVHHYYHTNYDYFDTPARVTIDWE